MYPWLFPTPVDPVVAIDPRDRLLRHAHVDGSAIPGSRLPRDLDPADVHGAVARRLPPGAVACLATAWALHRGTPLPPGRLDVVAPSAHRGVTTHALDLQDGDVTTLRGLRLTTAVRTVFDLARLAPVEIAAQALVDLGHPRDRFDAYVAARAGQPRADRALALSAAVLRSSASCSP